MEKLLEKSARLVSQVSLDFQRDSLHTLQWDWRLTSLIGARGVGKTTLMLQRAKLQHGSNKEAVYITLDDIYFTDTRLVDFAEAFYQQGGRHLYIDEVHKYPGWAREIKNIYDFFPSVKIVFTGSSIVELLKQDVDLSRRALLHELHGLSFREFLKLEGVIDQAQIPLEDLLGSHLDISAELIKHFKPFDHYGRYLQNGYYPFFLEGESFYSQRLEQTIRLVIETDLDFIPGFDPRNARKIYQLFYILATNVPFKPNITKLSERVGVHRNTLVQYLHHLEKARLIHNLYPSGISISTLQKPEKLFLHNTNLSFAIAPNNINIGNLRETFVLSQLRPGHDISLPKKGDFLIDDRFTFEVGGERKQRRQISGVPDAYILADNIEQGFANKIPIWLMGFLY